MKKYIFIPHMVIFSLIIFNNISYSNNIIADSNTIVTIQEQENDFNKTYEITGGDIKNNQLLFHCFEKFSIDPEEKAVFSGSNGNISHILNKVTGNEISIINGLLESSYENADIYFFNPSGVIFGKHAKFNIPKSFYVSTLTNDFNNVDKIDSAENIGNFFSFEVDSYKNFGFDEAKLGNIEFHNSTITVGENLKVVSNNIEFHNSTITADKNPKVVDNNIDISNNFEMTNESTNEITNNTVLQEGNKIIMQSVGGNINCSGNINIMSNEYLIIGDDSVYLNANIDTNNSLNKLTIKADNITLDNLTIENHQGELNFLGKEKECDSIVINNSILNSSNKIDIKAKDIFLNNSDIKLISSSSQKISDGITIEGNSDNSLVINNSNIISNGDTIAAPINLKSTYISCSNSKIQSESGKVTDSIDAITIQGDLIIMDNTNINSTSTNINSTSTNITDEIKHPISINAKNVSMYNSDVTILTNKGNNSDFQINTTNYLFIGESDINNFVNWHEGNKGNTGKICLNSENEITIYNSTLDSKTPNGLLENIEIKSTNKSISINGSEITQISLDFEPNTNSNGLEFGIKLDAKKIYIDDSRINTANFYQTTKENNADKTDNNNTKISIVTESDIIATRSFITTSQSSSDNIVASIDLNAKNRIILSKTKLVGFIKDNGSGSKKKNDGMIRLIGTICSFDDVTIDASTSGKKNAGSIKIESSQLIIDKSKIISNARKTAVGEAGTINISAKTKSSNFKLGNSEITTSNYGNGPPGEIAINMEKFEVYASSIESIKESNSNQDEVEGVGKIDIINSSGLFIKIYDSTISTSSNKKNSGDIKIIGYNNVNIENNSKIFSNNYGIGSAGQIEIKAKNDIEIETGSEISSKVTNDLSKGNAGVINIFFDGNFKLNNQSEISTSNDGLGSAGDIIINEDINKEEITGRNIEIQNYSKIFSKVNNLSSKGDAGKINISSKKGNFKLNNQSEISTSNDGLGSAGDIIIEAHNDIEIETGSEISSKVTNDLSEGNAGVINVSSKEGNFKLNNQSEISTSNDGEGAAGEIDIKCNKQLILLEQTQITTNSIEGNAGKITIGNPEEIIIGNSIIKTDSINGSGGDISIDGNILLISSDSEISAKSDKEELNGSISINAVDIFDVSIIAMNPPYQLFDPALKIKEPCIEREYSKDPEFIIYSRDGIPSYFDDWLVCPFFP